MKIALVSSAIEVTDKKLQSVANKIAEICYQNSIELVSGGCIGVTELATRTLAQLGGLTTVFSPDVDGDSHSIRHDNLPLGIASHYFHTEGFTQRSLNMINYVDGLIVVGGRMGTLSEVSIALEEGKRVGVITNTGGIANQLENIIDLTQKDFTGKVLFSDNPDEVISWIISEKM